MRSKRQLFSSGLLLVMLSLALMALAKRQVLYDWWRLRNYRAPAAVASLAVADTMNDSATRLFYVYHPELDDKQAFSGHCSNNEQTIVLGCYVSRQGIYLYNVTDPRLAGVQQVTAAHEMLHAAYDRLSAADRKNVNALITEAYAGVTDERIRGTIDSYRQKGADTTNELHSILGTEVRSLPPALENYYKRYFNNRLVVVGFSEQYEAEFSGRKAQVTQYDAQLKDLKTQIDANQSDLSAMAASLNAERTHLNQLLNSQQTEAYNAAVPGFNQRVRQYNRLVDTTKNLIDQYNRIVSARNNVALEEQQLIQSLDSRLPTQNAQ